MKPRLYLHIGRPKTGSTALQGFLLKNRERLAENGICYAETGRYQRASHKLSLPFLPQLPDHKVVKNLRTGDIYQQLVEEIQGSQAQAAVISSEHFWLVKPKKLPSVLKEAFDVSVVAYLRRQDNVLISSFIQEVKSGGLPFDFSMDDYINNHTRKGLLDYYRVLDRWGQCFGHEAITVRVFEELDAENGIEKDFLSLLGLEHRNGFKFSAVRKNASPSLQVLRLISELGPLTLDEVSRRRLATTFTNVEAALETGDAAPAATLLSREQRARVLSFFNESNSKLCREYLDPARHALFPPLEEPVHDDVPRDLTAEQRQQLLTGVVAYQQRQIVLLQNRLQRLEENAGLDGRTRLAAQENSQHTSLLGRLLSALRKA